MNNLSKILSLLLHPLFMPLIVCFICLNFIEELNFLLTNKSLFFSILSLTTIITPCCIVLILLKNNKIKSLKMNTKKERILPLFFTSICILAGYFVLKKLFIYIPVLNLILLGAVLTLILAAIISKFWKISLHMLGVGGGTGVFLSLHYLFGGLLHIIIFFLLLSGLLGSSRIKENAHGHAQVYVGFLTGLIIELFIIIGIKPL